MEVLQSGGRVAFQLFHLWEHALLESAVRVHEGTPGSPLGRGSEAQEGGYTASEPLTCERTPLLPIHIYANTTFFSPPFMQKGRHTPRSLTVLMNQQMHKSDAQWWQGISLICFSFLLFLILFTYFASQFILTYGWICMNSKSPGILLRRCCGNIKQTLWTSSPNPSPKKQMRFVSVQRKLQRDAAYFPVNIFIY